MNNYLILLIVIICALFILPDFINTNKYIEINKVKSPNKTIYYP